jgi:hypothetical protein
MDRSMNVCRVFGINWNPIVGNHCATMRSKDIHCNPLLCSNNLESQGKNGLRRNNDLWSHCATTTYVIWREEHLWNVCVLQRVHLSNLVCIVGMEPGIF